MLTEDQRSHLHAQVVLVERRIRRLRRWRLIRRLVAAGLLLILVVYLGTGVVIGISVFRAARILQQVAQTVQPVRFVAQPSLLLAMQGELDQARSELDLANALLPVWKPLLYLGSYLPHVGAISASMGPGVEATTCATRAVATVVDVGVDVKLATSGGALLQELRAASAVLRRDAPRLAKAHADSQCAIAARKQMNPVLVAAYPQLAGSVMQLDSLLGTLDPMTAVLEQLPRAMDVMLGMKRPQRYLVLGEDPFEMRATGGFVGGMGLVTVSQGAVRKLDYRGVLDFETHRARPLPAPGPLLRYMGISHWYLRDANWSPDFPTSARLEEQFFHANQGVQPDSVIAIDIYAVQSLLRAIGPVYVPEYRETVSADNLLAELWKNINASGILTSAREMNKTDFLSALVRAMLRRLEQPTSIDATKLLEAVLTAIRQKHLQIYFNDPALESVVRTIHADGALWSAPGDGLEVVDTQVSYGKMSAMVKETEHLDVFVGADGRVQQDRLTVIYQNLYNELGALRVWKELHSELYDFRKNKMVNGTGIYATYLRVLVPEHSVLLGVQGSGDAPGYAYVDGKSQLSAYLVVRPGQTRSLTFRYRPAIVGTPTDEYALTWEKQPGTVGNIAVVTVHLPRNLRPIDAGGAWRRIASGTWQLRTTLVTDRVITLRWRFT
ncbi:MAG: DUF4012 domain-containing protein [Chloroflexi bacterium]|nr:DUF4012 domain-containing protein [Chloroflexota bacterium]